MTSEIKNRKQQKSPEKRPFVRAEFINYDLTADDKGRFKAWLVSDTFPGWDLLDKLLESGYTISIKPDTYHDCYAAFIQPVSAEDRNFGFILSGRSSSAQMAIFGALFRHYVLFECEWPTDTYRRGGLDDD